MFKQVFLVGLVLVACSNDPEKTKVADCVFEGCKQPKSNECTVSQQADKSIVTCPDGSSTVITNGKDGTSCSVTQVSTGAVISCTDGTVANTNHGTNGTSCTVKQLVNGVRISCSDSTEAVVYNGQDGANGADAPPTPYTVTALIDPCGKQTTFDEVLLKLSNGTIIAHFASGANQFLTPIGTGTYMTTDGTNCYFTVDANNNVSW
jgi:hypothetical protein